MTRRARERRQNKRGLYEFTNQSVWRRRQAATSAVRKEGTPTVTPRVNATSGNNHCSGGKAFEARRSFSQRSHSPGSARRRCCLRNHLSTAQPPRLRFMLADEWRPRRSRRSDAGGLPAAFPQDSYLPRRIRIFLLDAPPHCEHCPHALPQEKARPCLSGRNDSSRRRKRPPHF